MYQAWPWGGTAAAAAASPTAGFVQPAATGQIPAATQWPAGYGQYAVTPEIQQQWAAAWASQAQYAYSGTIPVGQVPTTNSYPTGYPEYAAVATNPKDPQTVEKTTVENPKTAAEELVPKDNSELEKLNKLKEQAEQWKSLQQPAPSAAAPSAWPYTTAANVSSTSEEALKTNASLATSMNTTDTAKLDKEEEEFERQFKDWEKKFEDWKQENKNHPDKEAFARYEKQWQDWRSQLLMKKEQMQKDKAVQQSTPVPEGTIAPSAITTAGVTPTNVTTMADPTAAAASSNMFYPPAQYMYMPPFMYPGGVPMNPSAMTTPQPPYAVPNIPSAGYSAPLNQPAPDQNASVPGNFNDPNNINMKGGQSFDQNNEGFNYNQMPPNDDADFQNYEGFENPNMFAPEMQDNFPRDMKFGRGGRGNRGARGMRGRGRARGRGGQSRWFDGSEAEPQRPGMAKGPLLPAPPTKFSDGNQLDRPPFDNAVPPFDAGQPPFNDVPPFEYPSEDMPGFASEQRPFSDNPSQRPNFPSDNRFSSHKGSQSFPPEDFNEPFPPQSFNDRFPPDDEGFRGNRYPPNEDRFHNKNSRFAPDNERFPPGNERFGPEDENFVPGPDGFSTGPDQFPLGSDRGQSGPERFPPGPDRGSERFPPGPDRGQTGPERFPPGPDRGQSGPDRFPPGPDRGQSGSDRFPSGPDRGQPGPDRGLPAEDMFLSGPDRFPPGPEDFPPRGPENERFDGRDFDRFHSDNDMYGPPPFRDDFPPFDDRYPSRGRFPGRGRRMPRGDFDRFGPPPFAHGMRDEGFGPDFPPDDRFGFPDDMPPRGGPGRGGMHSNFDPGFSGRGRFPDDRFFEEGPGGRPKSIDYTHRSAEAVMGEDYNPHYDFESDFQNDVMQYRDNFSSDFYIASSVPIIFSQVNIESIDYGHGMKPMTTTTVEGKKDFKDEPASTTSKVFEYSHRRERSPLLRPKPVDEERSGERSFRDRERESFRNRERERNRDREREFEKERERDRDRKDTLRDNRDKERDRDRSREHDREREKDRDRENRRERDWEREHHKENENKNPYKWEKNHESERNSSREKNEASQKKENDVKTAEVHGHFKTQTDVFKNDSSSETVLIDDLLSAPKRSCRPKQLVIILRGLPGSGKTYVAKLIKDKEIENGGSAPRILSLDDYFMVEAEVTVTDPDTGKRVKKKEFQFEYEAEMEEAYRTSLFKSFKKTIDDRFFPFIIVDAVNNKTKQYEQFWSYAKQRGFQVYTAEMDCTDPVVCFKRNIHKRTLEDITKIHGTWEKKPRHFLSIDVRSLLQEVSITEVEMEVESTDQKQEDKESSPDIENDEESDTFSFHVPSRWEKLEATEDKLDKLDGLRAGKKKHSSMEDYLQLPDDYEERKCTPGKKRVRWADLEEKKEQDRLRAIGFVVGQTDWTKLTDPTHADRALTKTKYF